MDDKEYYSLMNRSSSYALQQALKKKQQQKKTLDKKDLPVKEWEVRQGKADAEMLYEKQTED